jgi:two-component system cell cycle response regulator
MTGRILVVDDVVQNVRLLEAKLSAEYYSVFPTFSGIECLEKVKEIQPDIILLDVMMPEMDGFETCRRLKEDPETAHIPVVMVTALSEMSDRVQGLAAGATDFLTKPIDEVHLMARVKSLIRVKVMLDELRLRDKTGSQLGMLDNSPLSPNEVVTGNIIIIDDDIVQQRDLQNALANIGHSVNLADPDDAMQSCIDNTYELIIISTMLDEQDGLRLAMQIRSAEPTRQIPIMILVDEDDKPILIKGLEIGIDDYITTPVDKNELIARCNTQIRRKKYQKALQSSHEESLSAAIIDPLTKLHNRRYLDAHLQNITHESLEKSIQLSLFTIDIDHFKQVNDRPGWGHDIGDEVLIEVAERIRKSIRSTDLATRPGGEEFVVVLPGTDIRTAEIIAERTRHNMSATPITISAEPGACIITVSIGVSTLNFAQDTPATLLKRSDEGLFRAKDEGRDRVIVVP